MKADQAEYSIQTMSRTLGISRSEFCGNYNNAFQNV